MAENGTTAPDVTMNLSIKDFCRAKKALEKANIPGPYVIAYGGKIYSVDEWYSLKEIPKLKNFL